MSDIAKIEWTDHTLAQCRESEVSTVPFVKQLGTVPRETGAGPKGGDVDRWPADLRIREFPAEPLMPSGSDWPVPGRRWRRCG